MYAGKACNQLTFDVARPAIQYSPPADEPIPVVGKLPNVAPATGADWLAGPEIHVLFEPLVETLAPAGLADVDDRGARRPVSLQHIEGDAGVFALEPTGFAVLKILRRGRGKAHDEIYARFAWDLLAAAGLQIDY